MTPLTITALEQDGTHVLEVHGDLDLATHGALRDAVQRRLLDGPAHLVVDLTGTTFIDSIALGTLIGGRRKAHTLQGSLVLVLGNDRVRKIFAITGLTKVFTTYDAREDWENHRTAGSPASLPA